MSLRSKKNRNSYFINTGATTSCHRSASDDNIHGQEMFKTMIQFPNHERTRAGLAAAAARGRKGGRKPVVTADKLQRAREYIATGLNVREAASRLRVSKTALYAALQNRSEQ